jgi:hypothetical protein
MTAFTALVTALVSSCLAARLGDAPTQNTQSVMADKWEALKLRMGVLHAPVESTTDSPYLQEQEANAKDLHKADFSQDSKDTDATEVVTTATTTTTKSQKMQWVKTGMGVYMPVTMAPPEPSAEELQATAQKKLLLNKAKEGTTQEKGLSTLASLTVGRNCEGSDSSLENANPLPNVKIIFVNEDSNIARRDCVEKQLERQCLSAARFSGVKFERSPAEIMTDPANKECAKNGLDTAKAMASGKMVLSLGEAATNTKKMGEILAEWCSHYRLMDLVKGDYNTMSASEAANNGTISENHYDYVLMLDDTVVLSEANFVPVMKDFIENYTAPWDIVQFDVQGPNGNPEPFIADDAKLEFFREKMVFMPKTTAGHFSGFQAVMMKAKSLPQIMEKMASMKVMPIDFLLKEINEKHFKGLTALTYQADITRSLRNMARVSESIPQPGYCIDLEL